MLTSQLSQPDPAPGDQSPAGSNGSQARWVKLRHELVAALGASVHFGEGHLAAYAADASNYRQVPLAVVIPRSIDELIKGIEVCRRNNAPVLMRGAGTSMSGQTVNTAVVFDISAHCASIIELDPSSRTALLEPGVICDQLRDAAEQHGLTFAPDPSTHSRCTLGGMIANNSCGPHSVMAGKTLENIEDIEVLTYDGARFWVGPTSEEELERIIAEGGRKGEIYAALRALRDKYADLIRSRFPNISRRVSGYNLDQLLPENGFNVARALVGTEGTCALTLRARVRLVHSPAHRVVLALGFPDIYVAADAVPEFLQCSPLAIEGLDRQIIRGLEARKLAASEIAMLPEGDAWVLMEFGGETPEEAVANAEGAAAKLRSRSNGPVPTRKLLASREDQKRIWSIRENGASSTQLTINPGEPDPKVGWEDAAVDPNRLGDYLRAFQALVDRYGYRTSLFGHFGDGCVHARITFDFRDPEGVLEYRRFAREAAQLVVDYGGSLSGEHGDGQAKGELLPIMFGDELMEAMRTFKRIWDPQRLMNPGKVVDARRLDEDLRTGPAYKVVNFSTKLQFRSLEGDGFQRAVERCVGMGRCRAEQGGTMCPSYRATHDERFSTRGRARVLWEMLQGDLVREGWQSESVKEALDTCLACKGCRSDCPTHTDMASYKAEFLSHYYERRRRPRQAISMGRIGDWAPIAGRLPGLANALTRTPVISSVAKRIAGVASGRTLPRFAPQTHSRMHKRRPATPVRSLKKVVLWVDTFCEHFHPEIANAAVDILEIAGFDTQLPTRRLCCGRPLYDYGYLDVARERLRAILDTLSPMFDGDNAAVALVGLEPGCMSVFKDELLKMFPDDPRAKALSDNAFLLADFLNISGYRPPEFHAEVIVHAHCHQKSLFGVAGERAILGAMGVNATWLDSGCCGMAGSFGFDPKHQEISANAGELVLLPAVREAPKQAFILTNGFSCREQIQQKTGRQVVHFAELLKIAHKNAETRSDSGDAVAAQASAEGA
ncbi:FAD-binding and (Fe-S)-binding domain-containing protein [Trinickia mobilis]|uniref:FAD-binding and (Fe-S)-binding domain-containing protein n=1 Tax=Trinickia mobilis TaxID=2816356 RepID=UPI001A8E534F|nr:FAD-binding and (Fe-S)-binding domain-containing protein [Trinickia mobilis]